jgi:hypothetical protein
MLVGDFVRGVRSLRIVMKPDSSCYEVEFAYRILEGIDTSRIGMKTTACRKPAPRPRETIAPRSRMTRISGSRSRSSLNQPDRFMSQPTRRENLGSDSSNSHAEVEEHPI